LECGCTLFRFGAGSNSHLAKKHPNCMTVLTKILLQRYDSQPKISSESHSPSITTYYYYLGKPRSRETLSSAKG
jgi:hypothetical protein